MAKGKKQKNPFGLPKIEIPQEGPKTLKGMMRKVITGDGRKSTPMEKSVKEANKAMEEAIYGKKKKREWKLLIFKEVFKIWDCYMTLSV